MASFLDKFKITTGIDNNVELDLSCQHITTSDFMHVAPVYIKEMVPGETLKVHQETFSRMAPLQYPAFGRGLIHNRAFFVPMRVLWKDWNEFITNTNSPIQLATSSSSSVVSPSTSYITTSKVPTLLNVALVKLFLHNSSGSFIGTGIQATLGSNSFVQEVLPSASDIGHGIGYDIAFTMFSGSTTGVYYFKLTNLGRRVLKIFESLGYKIVWVNYNSDSGAYDNMVSHVGVLPEYSALPLYTWFKVIMDWYYPSQYVGEGIYAMIDSILKSGATNSTYGTPTINDDALRTIFGSSASVGGNVFKGLVNYDSDYFVSAFDNPTGPSTNNGGVMSISDINYGPGNSGSTAVPFVGIDQNINTAQVSSNGQVPVLKANGTFTGTSYSSRITQYGLDALHALTDYMKRHQLVGARALDRFYARFGKSLDSAKMDRSYYIGSQNIPLQFADVMSHAETDYETLGAYAGKGIAYGNDGNYEYTTDEYGFFVVFSSIVPQIGYYQGMDRTVLHVGRTDFWTPEFDQLGNQAISKLEVNVPMNGAKDTADSNGNIANYYSSSGPMTGIFGYTPRYSEYKIGKDRLTGDWRLATRGVGDTSDAWHLFRNVGRSLATSNGCVHDDDFVIGTDWNQYDRIFQLTGDSAGAEGVSQNADKFYLIHTFNVLSKSPMHSLYDTYKFENEDEGAKKVVGDVNGVKVN